MNNNIMKVRIYGDPVLSRTSERISRISTQYKELASKMFQTNDAYDGVGLAAPQIGISERIIILDVRSTGEDYDPLTLSPGEALLLPQMPVVMVNPKITAKSNDYTTAEEGCLSIPDVWAPVSRPTTIQVHYQTLGGESVSISCAGFLSRVIQHEIDHLDGVLFVDRLLPVDEKKIKGKLAKLKKLQNKKRPLK